MFSHRYSIIMCNILCLQMYRMEYMLYIYMLYTSLEISSNIYVLTCKWLDSQESGTCYIIQLVSLSFLIWSSWSSFFHDSWLRLYLDSSGYSGRDERHLQVYKVVHPSWSVGSSNLELYFRVVTNKPNIIRFSASNFNTLW